MKKVLFLALLLLPSLALADFNLHVSPTKVEMFQNETREIEVTVVNFDDSMETLEVSLTPKEDWIEVEEQVNVAGDSSEDFIIELDPPPGTRGRYLKTLTVSGSVTKTKSLEITVKESQIEITELEPSNVYRPAEEVTLSARLVNRGKVVDNALFSFEIFGPDGESYVKHQREISLGQEKTVKEDYTLKPSSQEGTYRIVARLVKGVTLAMEEENFYVESSPVVSVERSSSFGLFSIVHRRTVTNLGNEPVDYNYNESIPSLGAMFFASGDYQKDGEVYSWDMRLQPLEARVITYELSYLPIAMVLLAILSIYIYIHFFYSRVTLSKSFLRTGTGKGAFKVMLSIKNKSGSKLSTVIVRDKVPVMFRITRQFGVLKPVIRSTDTHTSLVWHLRNLGPGEERVFTYEISPTMGLTEDYSFPKARAIFEQEGTKKTVFSDSPKIGVKETEVT